MPRQGRLIAGMAVAAIAAVAAMALAGSSFAGPEPIATIKISKHKNGPFKGGEIKDNLSVGEIHDYYFKVSNNTDEVQDLSLDSFASAPEYKETWFKGDKNITHAVTNGGYAFTLKQKTKLFRAHVKKKDSGSATCVDGQLYQLSDFVDYATVAIDADSACV